MPAQLDRIIKQVSRLHSVGAEAPTQYKLVEQVIDQLNHDWGDPTLTYVDPACGRGNFLLAFYDRLKKAGHSPRHIVNRMLWGCDKNPVQAAIARKALLLVSGVESKNIYCEDSLIKEWDMQFDVFATNPPFQKPDKSGRDDDNLWPKFIELSDRLVKPGGEIALVTPASWASLGSNSDDLGSKIRKQFFDTKQVKYVDFTAGKYFNEGSTFSAYVIRNDSNQAGLNTQFVFADKTTSEPFANYPCIPLKYSNSEFANIIRQFKAKSHYRIVSDDPFPEKRASMKKKIARGEYSTTSDSAHPYRAYHTNSQTHLYSRYSSSIHNQWKAVFSYSGSWNVEVTNDCSLTDASLAVVCETQAQAESVQSVLTSAPIAFLIDQVYRWSGYYSAVFLSLIPALPMDRIYTDDEVYQLMFTKKQAKLIQDSISQLPDRLRARLLGT